MTTWQDQKPQSRRALRERERAHTQVAAPDSVEDTVQEHTENRFDQQNWQDQPASSPSRYSVEPTRDARPAEEPLRRPRPSGSRRAEPEPAAGESPAYRVRDFSPESRGNSFTSTQSAPWTPPSPGSEDLSYHTSVGADERTSRRSAAAPSAPPIVVTPEEARVPVDTTPPAGPEIPSEHTLSRRELRELRRAAEEREARQAPPELIEPEPVDAAPTEPEPMEPELVEPEQIALEPIEPEPIEPEPTFDTSPPAVSAPPPIPRSRRDARAAMQERAAADEVRTVFEETPEASVPPLVEARSDQVSDVVFPPEPLREVVTAPEVYSTPAEHWSTRGNIDEDGERVGRPHQRDITSIDAITTSALVLPSFPVSMPTSGPVSGTGEVLMTGSINLPRSLGVNGLHPSRYDRPDIDEIIDASDRDASAPDSAPVRAVRAVSTYTSTQGIINAKRPKSSNLPMVLSITAGVMMVGVVVLVVVGMIFKIF